jgi:hypothetical protein
MKPDFSICTSGIRQKAWLLNSDTVYFWENENLSSINLSDMEYRDNKKTTYKIKNLNSDDGRSCSLFAVHPKFLILVSRYNVKTIDLDESTCNILYEFETGEFSRFCMFHEKNLYIANNKREILFLEFKKSELFTCTKRKVPGEPDWTNDLNTVSVHNSTLYFATDDGNIGFFNKITEKVSIRRFRDLHINASNHSYSFSQSVSVFPSSIAKFGDVVYKFSINEAQNEIKILDTFKHPRRELSVNCCSSNDKCLVVQFSGKFLSIIGVYDVESTDCFGVIEETVTINSMAFARNGKLTLATTDARLSVWSLDKTPTQTSMVASPILVQFESELSIKPDESYHIPGQSLQPLPIKNLSSLEFNWNEYPVKNFENLEQSNQIELPEEIMCPITQEIMIEPVKASDQRVYEKNAIELWLDRHGTSPFTREKMFSGDLVAINPDSDLGLLLAKYNGSQTSVRLKVKPIVLLL